MNILETIVRHKREEVNDRKNQYPVKVLEQSLFFSSPVFSMRQYLRREDKTGIIAEIKRKSPSKGIINQHVSVERTSVGYVQAGASALSVLTDKHFFGGSNEDLITARRFNLCPILRKDFILDEYQIVEAKAIGADVILLIAAILEPSETKKLTDFAHSFGLEVLLEVHNEEELTKHGDTGADLIGVNNRNLKTFDVSTEVSKRLAEKIPAGVAKVSESGIASPSTIVELRQYGYEGFLMGENFMKHSHPEKEAKAFMDELRRQLTIGAS